MLSSRPLAGRSRTPGTTRAAGVARGLVGGVVVAALSLGAAGCSTVDKARSAAIVNGTQIGTDDLSDATRQYNASFAVPAGATPATEQQVLPFLVNAKIIGPWASRTGAWKPDTGYAAALARVPDAAPATRDLIEALTVAQLFQQGALPQAAAAALEADFRSAKVQLAPRYGSYDPASPFALKTLTPGWIKQGSNPAASAPAVPTQ